MSFTSAVHPDHGEPPSGPSRPRSTSSSSKALLAMALLEAQSAVQLDNENEIPQALEAYRRTVVLLGKVMEASTVPEEKERLKMINDSYLFRMDLLILPPVETTSTAATDPLPPKTQDHSQEQQQQPPSSLPKQLSVPTPSSSSSTLKGYDSDSTSSRRVKKSPRVPTDIHSTPHPPSSEHRSRRRADSASVSGTRAMGGRNHVRAHTGGGSYRVTGDIVSAAEQLQRHAQQRLPILPRIRSIDLIDIPIHAAPKTPLPPTPTPISPASISASAPPTSATAPASQGSKPPALNLTSNHAFLASLAQQAPPPPKSALPPTPTALSSPPPSPAHQTRRVSPLVPSNIQLGTTALASPKSPLSADRFPRDEATKILEQTKFYNDGFGVDEWLPNLSSRSSGTLDTLLDQPSVDPYPRERHSQKSGSPLRKQQSGDALQSRSSLQHQNQHQRSQSGSSLLSTPPPSHPYQLQPISRSPLSLPFHLVDEDPEHASTKTTTAPTGASPKPKRISDSTVSSRTALETALHSPQSVSSTTLSMTPSDVTLSMGQSKSAGGLRHQGSGGDLSSANPSPALDKGWSPNLGGSQTSFQPYQKPNPGGLTLFDVIAEDPFGGLSFPVPPPMVDPPPADPYLRCFWLMRKLEQTMLTGGFLTKRMYIPRSIWYQSLVRLPAVDTKISACLTLTAFLHRMMAQARKGTLTLLVEPGGGVEGDQARALVLKELGGLEQAAVQIQVKLSRKLSYIHRPGKHGGSVNSNVSLGGGGGGSSGGVGGSAPGPTSSTGSNSGSGSGSGSGHAKYPLTISTAPLEDYPIGPATGPMSSGGGPLASSSGNGSIPHDWLASHSHDDSNPTSPSSQDGNKAKKGLAVGVAAVSLESGGLKSQWKSFSKSVQKSINNDKVEDSSPYTGSVLRLFQASYILESMFRHYNALAPFQTHIQIVNRLRRLCDFLNYVLCAFVVRDLGELTAKYVKRINAWVAE